MRRKDVRLCAVGASVIYMAAQMYVASDACGKEQPVFVESPVYVTMQTMDYEQLPTGVAYVETPEPTVTDAAGQENSSFIRCLDLDAEDAEILLRIAMAEAEGESTEGKALVMLVVLNRSLSDGFPDSIEDVVFQTLGGTYQFSPVAPGGRYWTEQPDEDCYDALELVMSGWDESQGAMYFEACAGTSWHSENLEFLFEYGGHRFYR